MADVVLNTISDRRQSADASLCLVDQINPIMEEYNMSETIVTPTALTPGIANFGPYKDYGGFEPSDAALVAQGGIHNQVLSNAYGTQSNSNAHFVRDAVDRKGDLSILLSEFNAMKNQFAATNYAFDVKAAVESAVAASEVTRLRHEVSDSKITSMLAQVLDRLASKG